MECSHKGLVIETTPTPAVTA